MKQIKETISYFHDNIKIINDSKIFAGLVILTLNISSKLISIPMSKTVEAFVKNNFSQYILVFAFSWVGTRDVFIAFFITFLFCILMEFLFNEKSAFCCLSEGFVSEQLSLNGQQEKKKVSNEQLKDTLDLIQRAIKEIQERETLI